MSNPRRVQAFYLRLGISSLSFMRRPTGYFAAWNQTNSSGIGTGARYMGPSIGTAQKTLPVAWSAVANDGLPYRLGFCQFLSDPFTRQSVDVGFWTLGFAQITTNAGATIDWNGNAALYVVDGRTGTRRATVFNLVAVGNVHTDADERTAHMGGAGPLTGQAFELFTGDYLCLEIGVAIRNTGGAAAVPATSIFADGTTEITLDDDVTASAKAALYSPVYFTTSLPQPGEPSDPTVNSTEAKQLVRGALPGSTFHDFDDSTSPDAELLTWYAEVFKRFGWDVLDLIARELDPRTAVLKLKDMRATWGVTQDPPALPEQRALVIARMREYGGPSSLFAIAAAVGVVLGYADPSALEIMEISADQLKTALRFNYLFGGAVPAAAAFDNTNLILRTPFILDGGAMWNAGSKLFLKFDISCGKQVHVRLVGPDGTTVDWSPITRWQEVTDHVLYGKDFAKQAVHGNWTLYVRREAGSPAVNLMGDLGPGGPGSALYIAGAPAAYVGPEVDLPLGPPQPLSVPNVVRGSGLGRHKFWWGVYADPALLSVKTAADFGAARAALGRLRHGYQDADLILSRVPIPTNPGDAMTSGSQALPDMCVPS